MEANALMQMAVALFGLAAISGFSIAALRLNGIPRAPHWLSTCYGALTAAGLVLACMVALTVGISAMARLALLLLLFAAASDSALNRWLHRNRLPKSFAVLRAFLAGVGFVLLLIGVYAQPYIARLPVPAMIKSG